MLFGAVSVLRCFILICSTTMHTSTKLSLDMLKDILLNITKKGKIGKQIFINTNDVRRLRNKLRQAAVSSLWDSSGNCRSAQTKTVKQGGYET